MPVVQVSLLSGRSKEQKSAMADEITETVHKHRVLPKRSSQLYFKTSERTPGRRAERSSKTANGEYPFFEEEVK